MTAGARELVGRLLAYPEAGYLDLVEHCREVLSHEHPEVARRASQFADQVRGKSLTELQELYTHTFDLNPVCSLEVGWQLYGEEYTRGRFLVAIRERLREHGVRESTELPDHLTHVLPLLDRMAPGEAREFARGFVAPALKKMLAALEGKPNPFADLLLALDGLLPECRQSEVAEVTHD